MKKKKILVIEDEQTLREEISEILEFEGFEVDSAENGKIGLQKAILFQPNLILSDVMMPEMDGIELLKNIRENDATKLMPFVFMTALAERENIRLGMHLGADDYITKPFTQGELLKAVSTRIQKHDAIAAEKELALNHLRTTIITRLPHELRSPLSGIIGFGTLLKDMAEGLSSEEVTDIGKEILNSGNRLLRLIENYLIYVQLNLGDTKKQTTEASRITEIVKNNALDAAKNYNRESTLIVDLANVFPLSISDIHLSKIIHELSDNAFRFSPPNTEVSIIGKPVGESVYEICISDKGRGFTAEQINNIGAYIQFDRDKLEQQGSGLGLTISKKMVELSDGEFLINSTKDVGTTITIQLQKG